MQTLKESVLSKEHFDSYVNINLNIYFQATTSKQQCQKVNVYHIIHSYGYIK